MVAYAIQFRRGTTAENASFTGLEGEVVVTTDTNTLVVHDGTTNGGKAVPKFSDLITDVSQLQDSTGVLGNLLSEIHNGTPVEPTVQVSGTAGSGLGSSSASPASDITALRAAGITTDGMYWFDNSISNGTPFQAYCKFNYVDGNDWYLLLKVHNQGDMTSGNPLWTNTTLHNETDDDLTSGNFSKYATWNNIKFDHLMMEMHQDGTAKYPPIMNFTTERTFAEAITASGGATAANGQNNIVAANSTSPSYTTNVLYHDTAFEYNGNTFTNTGLFERYVQKYGIGMWSSDASNSTTAEGFASVGRGGAWIGCPLDNNGITFGSNHGTRSDSGFGFGASGGNTPKTTSAGYCEWNGTSSTNTLPGYVWVRGPASVTSTSVSAFSGTWDDGYSLRNSSYNVGATYDANTYKWSLNSGGDTFAGVVPNANFLAAVSPGNNEGVWFKVKYDDMDGGIMNRKLGGWAFTATTTYASEGSADMLSATELRGDGNSVNNSASDESGTYGWSTKFNPGSRSSWWSALYFNPTTGYSAHYISHDDANWSLWADKTFDNPSTVQGIWATVWRRTSGTTASVTLVDVDATVLGLI